MCFTSIDDGFVTDGGSGGVGNIYRTTDGGKTWTDLNLLNPKGTVDSGYDEFGGGGSTFYPPYFTNHIGYLPLFCIKPMTSSKELLYFISKDGGKSWQPLS